MDSKRRSWMKAITWQILGLFTSMAVSYLVIGSWAASFGLSMALAATGLVMYALHERVWARIHWGR